jgi:hypothetical protein
MTLDRDQLRRWKHDRMAFRREAILLENGRPLGSAMDPWQEEDFRALDSSAHRHAYLERPRGHSKTGDVGTEIVADLTIGPANQRIYGAAVDEDQGRLLWDDVVGKFQRHPLLAQTVSIKRNVIESKATGSIYRNLNSDAASSWGLRPDRIYVDEFAEWVKRALWDSLWSATGKRPNCRVVIISTAGWDKTSLAWEVRQHAEHEDNWYFSSRGQCASWIRPDWLAQQRRTLPAHVFVRLHQNRWVDGVGAFLTAAEVDAIFVADLPTASGPPAIGLDLGVSKDRTVAAVVRLADGLVVCPALATWYPAKGSKVDLREVEDGVHALATTFSAPVIVDPYQAILMAQRLQGRGVSVREYAFTTDNRRRLFTVLLDLIRRGRFRARPHEELRRELLSLDVQETATGWRVDHRPGRHDDHVVAVALAAQAVADDRGPEDLAGAVVHVTNPLAQEILAERAAQAHSEQWHIDTGFPPPDRWDW